MKRKKMLVFRDVNKIFNQNKPNEVHAVKDVSMAIFEGEMVALMGPSGSGKSTMLNLIGGLSPATNGSIFVESKEVTGLSTEAVTTIRREQIGFIFQHFNLLEFLNTEQNVMLPLLIQGKTIKQAKRQATLLLRELGLGGKLNQYPSELSGGQEQRVAIARSLVTNPSIILGDEPTGDLDVTSANDVMSLFRRINSEQKQTLLLVTHSEKIGSLCDRIIRIEDGSIITTGLEKDN